MSPNYQGQAGQDLFPYVIQYQKALPKTFLDIGSHLPIHFNNSYFLEQQGWTGVCIEIEDGWGKIYQESRSTPIRMTDAATIDWTEFFETYASQYPNPTQLDYLSLDVDDSTRRVFDHFPFDRIRFATITVEHDAYRVGPALRDYLRERLTALGYVLICSDVFLRGFGEFEDWWVHPSLVDMEHANRFRCQSTDSLVIIQKMKDFLASQ